MRGTKSIWGIFTGVLENSLPFARTRGNQIMSTMAWLHVAVTSGYSWTSAMRSKNKGLRRAYATCPHDIQATIKALYNLSLTVARHLVR